MLKITLFSLVCHLVYCIDMEKPNYNIEHASYYFKDFIITYNKNYTSEERQKRLSIFTDNLKKWNEMNKMDKTAIYGINQFADLTAEEFKNIYLGYKPSDAETSCEIVKDADVVTNEAPAAFDWRERNAVSPVQNQGQCGSCYAFASIGNIESQYAIKHNGEFLDLSEQQLVDCSTKNYGCDGGLMTVCMQDIMDCGGIEAETDYPYEDTKNTCRFKPESAKIKLAGCTNYQLTDQDKLKEALYKVGPLAIAMDGAVAQSYHGGIIQKCKPNITHAVLLVGYGTSEGVDYWLIKNSWGATWGEHGYFRVVRDQTACQITNNIAASAVLP